MDSPATTSSPDTSDGSPVYTPAESPSTGSGADPGSQLRYAPTSCSYVLLTLAHSEFVVALTVNISLSFHHPHHPALGHQAIPPRPSSNRPNLQLKIPQRRDFAVIKDDELRSSNTEFEEDILAEVWTEAQGKDLSEFQNLIDGSYTIERHRLDDVRANVSAVAWADARRMSLSEFQNIGGRSFTIERLPVG